MSWLGDFARGFVRAGAIAFRENYDRSSGRMREQLTALPIAHRGLHTMPTGAGRVGPWTEEHRAENATSAFEAAIAHGYAIECDLQMTRDERVVVFHDRTLDRMTNGSGRAVDHTLAEIAELRLRGTDESIPTLAGLLAQTLGRVPLVLELKGEDADPRTFVATVARELRDYRGPIAVMSFLTPLTDLFRTALPRIPRGLTAQGDDRSFDTHMAAFERGDLHFVSYDVNDLPCRFTRTLRDKGVPVICWTVRTPDEVSRAATHADQITFEGFLPPLPAPVVTL